MAAIDALSRLPPLKDVETKAQGSTSALQKHREGRNVYQFLRSRPATTTSWDAGLSSAATAERSSHLSKITDQPWSPGRALPASAMQATGSRAAASTPPAMSQLPHAMHLSATAPYAVMLPGSKSSVQQQRRSPYQQAMTQRVMRKPMVSGGQAQVQAGPTGLAPGSPAPAASRQPPARVEPGHRGQWGTAAAEQHLSREPAGQPAGQRNEWAGQSTEAWRSARSSEALKKETRQSGPASPSPAAALWQQGQLHRHPATSRAKDGQQQPTAEHPARSNTDPTATQPHSLLPSHHSPAYKTQSGHAPGTWAASRAAAVNPVHTAASPSPAPALVPHDLTIPSRRTHPSAAPGQPSLPLATSPSQATLIASLLPVGSGVVTGAVSGAVLMPGMMSGAAAWTTGQEVGGRDRNHSPGRQVGPQQLVAARSYPKFVYSYTSLAKPLATSANPVLRAGHQHPLSRSTLAASPSLPAGGSLSHGHSATAHLHAAPAASTASEARLRGPGPGQYPGMSDCHPGDRLPVSSGLVPNPSRITALIANAPPTIDPGLGLSSHVSALRAGHVPGTGPALTQVLSLGVGPTPELEHNGPSLHLADAGGRTAAGLASTWAGVLQLGSPPQAHTQPLAPSPDPLHQLPQSDLAAHPTSPEAARSARLGLGAGLGHEAQGALPGAPEGRAVSSSHTHRTWSSSTYSSNSSSARGRAAKSPAPALASSLRPLLVGKAAQQAEAAGRAAGAAGGQAVGRGVGAVPWQQGPGGEWPTLDLDALYAEDSSSPVAAHPQLTLQENAWRVRLEPETSYQQHQHYQQHQYQQHQSVQQHQQQYQQQHQHQRLKVMEVIQVTPAQEDGVEHLSSELGGVVEGIQEDIHRALTQQVQVKMKFKLANSKPLPKLHPPGLSAMTSLPPALPPAQGGSHAISPGPQGANDHAQQWESDAVTPRRPALPPPQQHAHNPRQPALPTCHDQQQTSCMVPPHAAQPRQATPPSSHQPTSLSHHLTSGHSHFVTPQTSTHQAAADSPHPSAQLPPARPSSTAIVQPLAIAAAAARTPMYERRQLPVSPRPPEPPASHSAAAMSASSIADTQEAGQKLLDSSSLPRLPANVRVDVQEAEEEAAAALNAAAAEPPTAAAPPVPQPTPSGFNSSRPPTRQGLAEALVSVGAGLANAAAQLPPPSPLLPSALGLRASARPAGRTAAATMPGSLVVCVADMAGPWAGATQAVVAGTGLTAGQAESSQILHVLYEEQSIMQLGSTPSSRPASPSPTTPSTVTDTDTCHAVPDQATVLAQLQLPSPGLTLASPAAVSLTASLGSSSPSSLSEPLSLQSDSLPSTGAAELGFEGGSLARVVDVLQPAHGITGSGYGPHPANSTQGTAAVGGCCPGSITDSQGKADASRDSAPLPGAQEQGTIETPTGSARSVPQGAASSSQQPPAMTAAEVVDIMADASCEPAPGLPPPTLPSSPTPSPPTPSTPHAASADHAAGEQSLPPGAYQAHVFQQTPGELQAAQAHAAMLQQVQDSFHVRRSTEVDSDGLRLGLEPDPAPEFAEDLPSDVDGAFADGGSDGQSARLSDEASAAALFSDGGSDDGFNDVNSGSEDGEVLSVSAYAIEPAVKLSIKPADVPARRAVPPSDNDIIESNGMRLLGTKYEVQHMVGEGAYGKVMKCRVRGSSPDQWVAVKEFKIEDDDPDADDVKRTSRREVNLLRSLEHPNIVAFIDEFMVRDRLFIVMEFVPCNLLELLEAQPGGMDREAVRLILFQLCTAIAFIHAQHIVYRDVKPENLLINEQGHLKLCDFGFARHISPSGEDKLTDYVATRWYRAPELLLGPPYEDVHGTVQSKYGPAIDMWAIGCLMGELMDGEPLFAGDSDLDQLYRIQTVLGPVTPSQQALFNSNPHNAGIVFNFKEPLTLAARYEDRMTEVELDFLSRLLTLDPSQRITGQACLQHPYLADLGQQPLQSGQLSSRRSSSAMSGASSTTTSL